MTRPDQQRLADACARLGLTIDAVPGEARDGTVGFWAVHNWRVTLKLGRKRLSTDYFGGSQVFDPSAADVLYALLLDARVGSQPFADYCADFGLDTDSRKAEATWRKCRATARKLRRFLGPDLVQALSQLEH